MVSFKNDYSEGALPVIMEALLKTNLEQTVGYGEDEYTAKGIEAIKKVINFDHCRSVVHFYCDEKECAE